MDHCNCPLRGMLNKTLYVRINMKISSYNNLLVYDRSMSMAQAEDLISRNCLKGLEIKTLLKDERLIDLSFLKETSFLKGLSIVSNFEYDYSVIEKLLDLEWLNINAVGFNNGNFLNFHKLVELSLSFRRLTFKLNLPVSLRHLYMDELKQNSLNFISGVDSIQTLRIKSSNLKTIDGIDKFNNLHSLSIEGVSGLKSINELPESIQQLYLNSVSSLNALNLTTKPDSLIIRNCKKLKVEN